MARKVSKRFKYHDNIFDCRKSHLEHGQSKRSSNSSVQYIPKKTGFAKRLYNKLVNSNKRKESIIINLIEITWSGWQQINMLHKITYYKTKSLHVDNKLNQDADSHIH